MRCQKKGGGGSGPEEQPLGNGDVTGASNFSKFGNKGFRVVGCDVMGVRKWRA